MTVSRTVARLMSMAAAMAFVAGVTVASGSAAAVAASPAPSQGTPAASSPMTAAQASSTFTCAAEFWCDYIYDNGTGLCFKLSPFSGPLNVPNWGKYGCRNVDGSIYDNSPFTLRIYFSPNYGDPHACIKPFTKISDLFNYDFNSGSGPHNLVIGNDIASSTMSLSPCTNPL